MMKKILRTILRAIPVVLVLVFCLSVTAMAYSGSESVTLKTTQNEATSGSLSCHHAKVSATNSASSQHKASGEFYEATEDVGFHVGFERGGGVGRIICINTAFAEFKRVGAEIYKEALTLLLEAWGGDPDSLRAEIIQGIVHFVELYHGEYDRERLIYSLRAYEPKFIYAAGKAEKELRGVRRYVNLFYRIYNGRRKHSTLPMKF